MQQWCAVASGVQLRQCGKWQMKMDGIKPTLLQNDTLRKSKGCPATSGLHRLVSSLRLSHRTTKCPSRISRSRAHPALFLGIPVCKELSQIPSIYIWHRPHSLNLALGNRIIAAPRQGGGPLSAMLSSVTSVARQAGRTQIL